MANEGKSDRGFASMGEDKQRELAKKGGETVPDEKRSFSKAPELAAEAGRRAGKAAPSSSQGGSQSGATNVADADHPRSGRVAPARHPQSKARGQS